MVHLFFSSLFHSPLRSFSLCSLRSFLCLPSSTSHNPPLLSEEIDWVIWLGASSARFLAQGKERSGGDMTTCRNNNNIHNIGKVGIDGRMEKRTGGVCMGKATSSLHRLSGGFRLKCALNTNTFHDIVSPFLSFSIRLSISYPASLPSLLRFAPLLIANSTWIQADSR